MVLSRELVRNSFVTQSISMPINTFQKYISSYMDAILRKNGIFLRCTAKSRS